MQYSEFKAIRKELAMSQAAFASELGVSRVLVNQMERGEAKITDRTEAAARNLVAKVRLVTDGYSVDRAETTGEYIVVRRTVRERDRPGAIYSGHSEVWLYGKFRRRDHAYRWALALSRANDPRNTRSLIRQREA
ncbi:helix-turn-helix domain-containing protein [Sphingobium yanoikuyae]|uniref:helix-turn-helix domain-containing protein n=1 Tax=Sphingobium yanoikuyae TaxID=13690 RepID=UPI00242CF168|nr:helix-turn-helix domain-containing protein [Sphingobium yanoikuyae]